MKSAQLFAALLAIVGRSVQGAVHLSRDNIANAACVAEDLATRAMLQNKLAGICVAMCKEVGAYPEGCTCPDYTDTTDKTPNVVTWPELLAYMDKVEQKGEEALKKWR